MDVRTPDKKKQKETRDPRVDMYEFKEVLGKGAFGTTYLAKKKDNEINNYVIKEINLNSVKLSTILSEIFILKKIAKYGCKKNILCYIDYFYNRDNNTINIITEAFSNSMTLAKYIKNYQKYRSFIPIKELLQIMYSLLDALTYLHKIGIGHSDIKPENILINDNLEIQIIDFGLSCTKNCNPSGTILFAAPEILSNIGSTKKFSLDFIQRSDIFSMGVVFYLLANLELPFPTIGNNPYQLEEEDFKRSKDKKDEDELSIKSEGSIDSDTDTESELDDEYDNNSIGSFKSDNSDYSSVVTDFFEKSDENIVNLNNELTSIYTLSNFYKKRIETIISYYNYNRTIIDEKINVLIESMLKSSDKISKGRPSAKRLLNQLKKIIEEYNDESNSPITISPTIISPTTPKTPKLN